MISRATFYHTRSPSPQEVSPASQVDVSDEKQVEELVVKAITWGGKLDIWVNNAAKFVFGAATTASNAGNLFNKFCSSAASCQVAQMMVVVHTCKLPKQKTQHAEKGYFWCNLCFHAMMLCISAGSALLCRLGLGTGSQRERLCIWHQARLDSHDQAETGSRQ